MTVTNCADIAEDLSLHAAGEPSLEVEAHLAVCAGCRQRHAELRAICGALRALECGILLPLSAPQHAAAVQGEAPPHFDLRRALWPLAIAASVFVALWPSTPTPTEPASIPLTWFALQRAVLADPTALDGALAKQMTAFTATLEAAAAASPFHIAHLEP